ncbi:MAG: pitrilysin family protein [Acidobacteria bacterium]|nr:pitrilysin family protein [Acidobacteriota bacterium]MXZ37692.1 insulinase family protein [Holophagales bacterium]MYF05610.1 insulinase family protein [Holophagales bacterium]MYJ25060.1 insulinase family protein [Holophagales bacterium]
MTTVDVRAFDRVAGRAETLANGLQVVLLPQSGAESIVVALCYRAGSRDEEPGECGLAHFLEHMMFKGSAAYEPGAIDRLTQGLGGTNNAFTSHDATLYHFQFERGSWQEALRIESDRMRGLSLLPEEVELEREVILEEIRMVEDDPWDALEQAVAGRVFGEHPYGRSVLGTRESLRTLDDGALRSFHCRHYRPGRAVLVCAGGLPPDAMELVEAAFGREPAGAASGRPRAGIGPPVFDPGRGRRVEALRGETARLLVAHPAPLPDDPAHVHLRLALAVLCNGRSSRVQRDLVEEDPLALWASAAVTGHRLGGIATLSAEVAPGVHPKRLEEELYIRVENLATRSPGAEELERAKRILFADWVFTHEPIAERAVTAALEHALFSPGFSRDSFQALANATPADVAGACAAWLSAETRVVGWSLPAARPASVRGQGRAH